MAKADTHHVRRYTVTIMGGSGNLFRKAISCDLRNAVLKRPASKDKPAEYWDQAQQEQRLVVVWEKWSLREGIWTAASFKVQLSLPVHSHNYNLEPRRMRIS